MRDPYQVLGVGRTATEAEIKKAYRKLAKQHHPDANAGDTKAAQRFSEITGAYDLLTDRDKRAQFDRGEIDAEGKPVHRGFSPFGAEGAGGAAGSGPFRRWRSGGGGGGGFNAEDIFSDLFSNFGERGGGPPKRGRDLAYTLKVSFVDAARGTKKRVSLGGKTLDVNIPAGVTEGQQIRLRGQGEAAPVGGPSGDALITVAIDPHPLFTRDGRDIRLELPITLYEAVLGAKVRVPTLDGSVEVTVPPNSSSGKTLRLKGKGIQLKGQSTAGDQMISLRIVLPEQAGDDLRALARSLQEKAPYAVRGQHFGNKP